MIDIKHNNNSKEFLKKLTVFIDKTVQDAILVPEIDKNKLILNCLLNVKDSIISEIIRDNFGEQINLAIQENIDNDQNVKNDDQVL